MVAKGIIERDDGIRRGFLFRVSSPWLILALVLPLVVSNLVMTKPVEAG